jgi:hypothetical protein
MRMPRSYHLALFILLPCLARAQTGFIGQDGHSRYPGVTILCPNGTRAAPCSFGSGGNGGTVTIDLGTSAVGANNRFPVTDSTLDSLLTSGALPVTGNFWPATQPVSVGALPLPAGAATAAAQTAIQSAPGLSASTAVTVQGAASGVAVPVSGTFWPVTQPVSASSLPLPAGAATAAAQTAVQAAPGGAASLAVTVQGAASGVAVPVSGTFWQSTQPTADTALDPLVSGGALAVSAAALPLPAGAAKASYQTSPQAPVAPGAATATNAILMGCQSNTTLPSFSAGQQGAIPCDTSGRPYVVTVPSANNVPVYLQAISSGGAYTARAINAASSAMASVIKTSAGMLYGYEACNSGTSTVYLRIFNLGVAPTVGTSTPAISKIIPAGACQGYSTDVGLTFGTGIAFDVTAGSLADSDTTTMSAANQVAVEMYSH